MAVGKKRAGCLDEQRLKALVFGFEDSSWPDGVVVGVLEMVSYMEPGSEAHAVMMRMRDAANDAVSVFQFNPTADALRRWLSQVGSVERYAGIQYPDPLVRRAFVGQLEKEARRRRLLNVVKQHALGAA